MAWNALANTNAALVRHAEVHRRPAGQVAGVDRQRALGGEQRIEGDAEGPRIDVLIGGLVGERLVGPAAAGDGRGDVRGAQPGPADAAVARAPRRRRPPASGHVGHHADVAAMQAPERARVDVDLHDRRAGANISPCRAVQRLRLRAGREHEVGLGGELAAAAAMRSRRRCRGRTAAPRTGRGPSRSSRAGRRCARRAAPAHRGRRARRRRPRPATISGRSAAASRSATRATRPGRAPAARLGPRPDARSPSGGTSSAGRSIGTASTTGRCSARARRSARAASSAARRRASRTCSTIAPARSAMPSWSSLKFDQSVPAGRVGGQQDGRACAPSRPRRAPSARS